MTGVHSSLNPILVSDGVNEDVELLVVEGEIEGNKIRFMNGYGPQETADIEKRLKFFAHLEEEILKAKLIGALVCIELDANAKLGYDVIENDPHKTSANGELFLGVIERNSLIVGNATQLCKGVITRRRTTVNGVEQSVIDFLVVCEELFAHMTKMIVDEDEKYPIESHRKVGNKSKVTKTDHNLIIGVFNLKTLKEEKVTRREIFKYNDEEGLNNFRKMTSNDVLTKYFEEKDFNKAADKWLKELKNILHRSFKKVRIGNKKNISDEAVNLLKEKLKLKNEIDTIEKDVKNQETIKKKHVLEDKIEVIDERLANRQAEKQAETIIKHFEDLTEDAGFSTNKMWGLKKKLYNQNQEVPMAMKDEAGN